MIAIYDGSFENFLNLVYDIYYKKISPTVVCKNIPHQLILDDVYQCEYNEEKSMKVYKALKETFSKKNFKTILKIFMCDNAEFEMPLLEYIILGFKNQNELKNINNSSLFLLENLEKELFRNVHKMTGFLRFEEIEDGALYAKVESKFNVVYFLGRHFEKRFNNQVFYIHDVSRKIAYVHLKEYKGIREIASFDIPQLSQEEEKFRKLWKTFFQSVTIESKKNEKLQKNLVPLLYRTYMSEFIN